jgi:hypothetical protein
MCVTKTPSQTVYSLTRNVSMLNISKFAMRKLLSCKFLWGANQKGLFKIPKAARFRHKRQSRARLWIARILCRFHRSKLLSLLAITLLRHSLRETHARLRGTNTGMLLPSDYIRCKQEMRAVEPKIQCALLLRAAKVFAKPRVWGHNELVPRYSPKSALRGNSEIMAS